MLHLMAHWTSTSCGTQRMCLGAQMKLHRYAFGNGCMLVEIVCVKHSFCGIRSIGSVNQHKRQQEYTNKDVLLVCLTSLQETSRSLYSLQGWGAYVQVRSIVALFDFPSGSGDLRSSSQSGSFTQIHPNQTKLHISLKPLSRVTRAGMGAQKQHHALCVVSMLVPAASSSKSPHYDR